MVGAWPRQGWRMGGGPGNSEGGQVSSLSAVGDDRRKAGLTGQNGGGGGEEVVRRPSLDPVPEAIHAPQRSVCRGEEVSPICEYGAEETSGDAVA